ncbi:MAG: LytTR family transcriptional regulator DNA-binding domain-containing protein [Aquaticitalea sp.]
MKFIVLSLIASFLLHFTSTAQNTILKKAVDHYEKAVDFEGKNIDSSFVYTEKAYQLLKPNDTLNSTFSDVLNQYGRIYFFKKDYQKAYGYFKRCYDISIATNQEENANKVKVNMAVCQRQLNNNKVALEDLFDVANYYERTNSSDINLGKTYVNIADLYMLNKQHEFAETYYKKSTSFFEPDSHIFVQLQSNRIANFNSFDTDKSMEIITAVEATTQMDSLPVSVSAPLINSIAQTMVRTGNYEKGINYTLKGLEIKKKSGLTKAIAVQYNNMGDIYIKTKNYPLAITYLDSALETSATHRQQFQILSNLKKAHKGNNNLEQSLKYAEQYIALKDSLNEVLTQKEIAELGIKYQTKEQHKFIDKLQSLSLIYKFVIGFVLLLAIVIVYRLFNKNSRIKSEVQTLQDELAHFKELHQQRLAATASELIHLKSKAVLDSNSILYVKSDGHYVEYHLDSKAIPEVDRNKLSEVLKQLPTESFVRIHNSYIVNIQHIKIINSTKIMLSNGAWINLSRTYKQKLKDILHNVD